MGAMIKTPAASHVSDIHHPGPRISYTPKLNGYRLKRKARTRASDTHNFFCAHGCAEFDAYFATASSSNSKPRPGPVGSRKEPSLVSN